MNPLPLSESDLDAIEARCNYGGNGFREQFQGDEWLTREGRWFSTAARCDLRSLVAEVRRLRALLEALCDAVHEIPMEDGETLDADLRWKLIDARNAARESVIPPKPENLGN